MSLETITPASTIDTPDVLAPITEMNWALEMTQFRQRNLGNTACGGCPKIDLCGDTGVCADENETTESVPEQEAENNVKLEDDNPIAINTVPVLDEPQPAPEKSQPTQVETKATVAEDPKASDIIKPIDIIPDLPPTIVEQKLPDSETVAEPKAPELSSSQASDRSSADQSPVVVKPISKDPIQIVKPQAGRDIKASQPTTQVAPKESLEAIVPRPIRQKVEAIRLVEVSVPPVESVAKLTKLATETQARSGLRETKDRVTTIETTFDDSTLNNKELAKTVHETPDKDKTTTTQVKEASLIKEVSSNIESINSWQGLTEQEFEKSPQVVTYEISDNTADSNKTMAEVRQVTSPSEATPLQIKVEKFVSADVADTMDDVLFKEPKDVFNKHATESNEVKPVDDPIAPPTNLEPKSKLENTFVADEEIADVKKIIEITDDMLLPDVFVDLRAIVIEDEKDISLGEVATETETISNLAPVQEEMPETDSLILDDDKTMQELQPDITEELIDDILESTTNEVQDQEYLEEESSSVLKKNNEAENIDRRFRPKDVLISSDETEVIPSKEDEAPIPTVRAQLGSTSSSKPKSPFKVASVLGVIALFHSLTDILSYDYR